MRANVKGKQPQPPPWYKPWEKLYRSGEMSFSEIMEEIKEYAIAEARRDANEQADDICNRTLNEVWMAMDQAGLAKRTIERVRDIYGDVILKRTEEMRGEHLGDMYCEEYLTSRGLPYEPCRRET